MIYGRVEDAEAKEIKTFPFKGKSLPVKGTTIRWLSQVGDAALPEYGLRFFTIKPGGFVPMHQHEYVQTQIIMTGELLASHYDNDEKVVDEKVLGPGDYFYVEPMEIHGMKNVGREDVTFFCCICALQTTG